MLGRGVVGGIEDEWGLLLYAFYSLHTHLSTHARLCAELDAVLGLSVSCPATLKASPHLANALPYTAAVIKETLRIPTCLHPARRPGQLPTAPGNSIHPLLTQSYCTTWMSVAAPSSRELRLATNPWLGATYGAESGRAHYVPHISRPCARSPF